MVQHTHGVSRRSRAWRLAAALPWLMTLLSGCASDTWKLPSFSKADERPKDSLVLSGGRVEKAPPLDAAGQQDLDTARRLFQEKEYAKAEVLFHKLALKEKRAWTSYIPFSNSDDKPKYRGPDPVVEESLFYEAECQRLQKKYRDAEPTYKLLLDRFRNSQYTDRANRGLFEIADHWLSDTRDQMNAYYEQLEGKRWFVMPASYVHISQDKPYVDMEGRAVQALDSIRLSDINGPLGEKALFYLATVKFFNKDYREADFYFAQLYQHYPNSPFAAKAIKQSVICKQLCTGGTVYDCRPIEESKKLLHTAQNAYPELARDEQWIQKQLIGINLQQADRDWKIAEFYRRTGHPGSAYFYYELVRRRYPNTTYEERSKERLAEIKTQVEREQREQAPPDEARQDAERTPALEQGPAPRVLPSGLLPGSSGRP
jgi:outer membrane protein assembly factor BamD (BamD/ComL family)